MRLAAPVLAAGLVAAGLGVGTAQADPPNSAPTTYLAGVGSDTSQDVMNAIANSPNTFIGGQQVLGSWDATPPASSINPHPNLSGARASYAGGTAAGCTQTRPNGSGAGRTNLELSLAFNANAGDGCIQWSRSSALNLSAAPVSITYIPFAIDGVDYAITNTSVVPRSANLTDLQAIYHCDPNFVGTGPNFAITPMLPQAGSGTRSFWEATMGITDADVNNGVFPCIINGTKNGQVIEEHSGTLVDDKSIVPFSIPKYLTETFGTIADVHGRTLLGVLNGVYPSLFNAGAAASTQWPVTRELFNVIRSSQVGTAPFSTEFVGANSLVCQQAAIIQHFGFAVDPNCGSTTNVAPGAA
jgi:hypothetical protein